MRIIVGLELDYNDVGALMRLRDYLKPRSRKLYLLVRNLISLHYKAKYNCVGWVFALYFGIPPMWFYRFVLWVRWLLYQPTKIYRHYKGWYVCQECYCDVPYDPFYKREGFCKDCYHYLMEEYYNSYTPEEVEYYGG